MIFPWVGIAATIQPGMSAYRELFSRQSAYEHAQRYVQRLLLSAHQTLQGIYSQLVWPDGSEHVERRAMPAGVFESPWHREQLMVQHRAAVAQFYSPDERQMVRVDWTHGHHEQGRQSFGGKRQYDYEQIQFGQPFRQVIDQAFVD